MGIRVAITGVNSYVAGAVLPLLEADPRVEAVVGIDVTPWKGGFPKVVFHREDIRSDRIAPLLAGADALFHFAFVVADHPDKHLARDINVNGSRNVFEACLHGRVRKVVYASSMTVYGSHPDNPLGLKETAPLLENRDSRYNREKIQVENQAVRFFSHHPEIVFTVLRIGLICGPRINNLFSALWARKVMALPMGHRAHTQFIHEEDLGDALMRTLHADLPGIYNIGADDAIATRRIFRDAGVRVIPVPALLLKWLLQFLHQCRLEKMGRGWVSLAEHTIFMNCAGFKEAAGWRPKYTSQETLRAHLEARKRDATDTPKQMFLTWFYRTPPLARTGLRGLNALLFLLTKTPFLRDRISLTDPRKNNMTYLPLGKVDGTGNRTIPVNASLGEPVNRILSRKVLDDLIDRNSFHLLMDACICRTAFVCKHFTADIGCLFMGETAKKLPPGLGRRVTRETAHQHVNRAVELGLVPMTGKVNVDNLGFLTPDTGELLSVCFCCHCCCMMGYYRHDAGHLKKLFKPMEGLCISIAEACKGCGRCVETCRFDNIAIQNGRAVHGERCVGCGRCLAACPNQAVSLEFSDPDSVRAVKNRIETFVKFS
ncbi:MAG: NAD-dependent epimerase/dehydratase family protein [Thermodesulfobacteriota bacterium]